MILVCTLLDCPTTYERTIKLLDDAFRSYKNYQILRDGQHFELIINGNRVVAQSKEDFFYPVLDEEIEYIEIKANPVFLGQKEDEKGEIIGQIEISLSKRLIFLGNLYKL